MLRMLRDMLRFCRFNWMLVKYLAGPTARYLLGFPDLPSFGRKLCRFLESMGLTYLKLGQYLALRIDLLPPEVRGELERLFEDVAPVSFEAIREIVESELGGPLVHFFSRFENECLASASVAQVHRAWTRTGEKVAVKVQRPNIVQIFESDVRNLRRIARWADRLRLVGRLSMIEAVEEFRAYTSREMSFVTEGRTAERLQEYALSYEVGPRIYWQLTTERVLTMEVPEGISLARAYALIEAGEEARLEAMMPNLDMTKVARRLAHGTLRQLFVTGFFHADPHPGNVLLRDDNSLAVVDYGIFGHLNRHQRETLASYVEHVALGDVEESFRYYSTLTTPTSETDVQAYKQDAKNIFSRWHEASNDPDAPPEQRHLGKYANEMLSAMYRHRLRMSMDLLLFWRTLIALDSSALRLARHFDLLDELKVFFDQLRPARTRQVLAAAFAPTQARKWLDLARDAPGQGAGLLRDLSHGSYQLPVCIERPASKRQAEKARYRGLSLAVVSVSFAVLAISAPWDYPHAAAIVWTAGLLTACRAALQWQL